MKNSINTTETLYWNHIDHLLARIAIKIQLSPTNYSKAIERYQTINKWIERDDSPMKNLVELFYSQGSMAIGTTIAARNTIDEFDVDTIAEYKHTINSNPKSILDAMYYAIKGEPGARYYETTTRNSRCITVQYKDQMHLDVTPMLSKRSAPPREGWICHDSNEAQKFIIANPFGFAEWFNQRTSGDKIFAEQFAQMTRKILLEAEIEPVPEQIPMYSKSTAAVVLQLLKRWRNVQYSHRNSRQPPSIIMSKLVADNTLSPSKSLSCELLRQSKLILTTIQNTNGLLSVVNPVCEEDVLTDRWPASKDEQNLFITDLENFVIKLEYLINGDYYYEESKEILTELFGETPTHRVVEEYGISLGKNIKDSSSKYFKNTGRLVPPAILTSDIANSDIRSTKKHTFYGQ